MDDLARCLLDWYDRHGRHDLPWQHPRTPYRVWVSEIMLQQTQVATVIRYFERFVAALPDVPSLAAAPDDRVMALWSGLGYYRRAHHLLAAARVCMAEHDGRLPRDFDALAALPGIGRSTAGAIVALAHGGAQAILDGNVKRVLARFHGIHGWPGQRAVENELWARAESHLPATRIADYTQAIMDLGATVCTRANPRCTACPLAHACVAYRDGLTGELPTPKPGKPLPERQAVFVVLLDDRERILLERRPPQGIWPGLWSLPEAPDADAARELAGQLASVGDAIPVALEQVCHTFTHFKLRVTPLAWRGVPPRPGVADDCAIRYVSHGEFRTLGIPAPVARLLAALPTALTTPQKSPLTSGKRPAPRRCPAAFSRRPPERS